MAAVAMAAVALSACKGRVDSDAADLAGVKTCIGCAVVILLSDAH